MKSTCQKPLNYQNIKKEVSGSENIRTYVRKIDDLILLTILANTRRFSSQYQEYWLEKPTQ